MSFETVVSEILKARRQKERNNRVRLHNPELRDSDYPEEDLALSKVLSRRVVTGREDSQLEAIEAVKRMMTDEDLTEGGGIENTDSEDILIAKALAERKGKRKLAQRLIKSEENDITDTLEDALSSIMKSRKTK